MPPGPPVASGRGLRPGLPEAGSVFPTILRVPGTRPPGLRRVSEAAVGSFVRLKPAPGGTVMGREGAFLVHPESWNPADPGARCAAWRRW